MHDSKHEEIRETNLVKLLGSESFTRWLVGGEVIIAFKEFKPFFLTMYQSHFAPSMTYLSKLSLKNIQKPLSSLSRHDCIEI